MFQSHNSVFNFSQSRNYQQHKICSFIHLVYDGHVEADEDYARLPA